MLVHQRIYIYIYQQAMDFGWLKSFHFLRFQEAMLDKKLLPFWAVHWRRPGWMLPALQGVKKGEREKHVFCTGVGKCPMTWVYWTSPYSSHKKDHIPNGWVMWKMGTFNDPCCMIEYGCQWMSTSQIWDSFWEKEWMDLTSRKVGASNLQRSKRKSFVLLS